MPKRTICIQNPAKLSVKNRSLVIQQEQFEAAIPLEDIWVVILETHRAQVTARALSEIVDAGIGVMTCGHDHMPNGLLLPIGAHSRHAAIVEDQLLISRPLKKRLWQRIVIAKISNQANVLNMLGKDASALKKCVSEVLSGDTSSRESVAAGIYFKALLPSGSRREGPYAAALDYGYSILRAGIARAAVAGGWLVSRGIHHANNLNAFNLVDDLIEPFRPVVDLIVVEKDLKGELDARSKGDIARVFEYNVTCGNKRMSVQTAIERELETLRDAVLEKDADRLLLPTVSEYSLAAYGE